MTAGGVGVGKQGVMCVYWGRCREGRAQWGWGPGEWGPGLGVGVRGAGGGARPVGSGGGKGWGADAKEVAVRVQQPGGVTP